MTARRMWEISENLHRAELSALERDKLVAEWCQLVGKEVSGQVVQKPQGGRPQGGVSEASRQLGLERKDVERAVKVASLTPEAQEKARITFNHKENIMEHILYVSTLEEAATEGYRQGFEEGYAAARMVIESVVTAWRQEPHAYDLEGALKALDMSREKAKEMLGSPIYKASPAHVVNAHASSISQ